MTDWVSSHREQAIIARLGSATQFAGPRGKRFYQLVVIGGAIMPARLEDVMRAERVEVTWDVEHAKWSVRIVAGEEVIRRHSDVPKSSHEPTLRAAAA